jgi:hypothetical protein
MDALSVISGLSDKAPVSEEPSTTKQCDHSVTWGSTDPTSYLTSLVEQGISLCGARRSLEEEILKSLEKQEKLHLDAVESAKISLMMTRRDAVDIVTRLKVASGGIINIILPWQNEVEKERYEIEKKPHNPTALPSPVIPAMPIPACPAHIPSPPVPTIVDTKSTLTLTPLTLAATSEAVVNHCIYDHQSPLTFWTNLLPSDCLTPTNNLRIPPTPPAMPPPIPNVREHQELLQRYEAKMIVAKGAGDKALTRSMIPWPVLISQFPLHPTDSSLSTTTLQANLQDFITSYSQWKQLSFEETSAIMLRDWVLVMSKLKPKKMTKIKKTIDRVIDHLRTFSNSTRTQSVPI